jgi:hypothetical protein
MFVLGFDTILRRWQNKKPTYIVEHPLPDPDELNAAIPQSEWEIGLDGKPRQPWMLCVRIFMCDLHQTGSLFTYAHDTWGAMLCLASLEEAVAVMRTVRGVYVLPIVNLEKRPWKTTYGMSTRPHLHPISWREVGSGAAVQQSPMPQLTGPETAATPTPTPTSAPATAPAPAPAPAPAASTPAAPPTATPTAAPTTAPAASSASVVLDNTKPVRPVTVAELVADEIPWK